MKFLHAADLHLDTAFTGHSAADAQYLKKHLLAVPEKLAQLCLAHQCDALLLSGDLFDGPASPDSVDALKKAMEAVAVPVFISPGNHDFCAAGSPYLTEIWPANVHIFTRPSVESVAIPHLNCRFYGAGFSSMDCPALMENFRTEGDETWHIGVFHGDPVQKNSPYNPISQSQIAGSELDYLALGHIHKAGQFLSGKTLCAWPGCPMGRGNDETGEKGVYLVTLADGISLEFIPLDTPRFYDLEAEVQTTAEDALCKLLPPVGSTDFYRVTLTGEAEPFDADAIRLEGFPHLTVRDRTVLPVDLWASVGQDNLEGVYFGLLQEALQSGEEETVLLAAKISRRILDGREVILP